MRVSARPSHGGRGCFLWPADTHTQHTQKHTHATQTHVYKCVHMQTNRQKHKYKQTQTHTHIQTHTKTTPPAMLGNTLFLHVDANTDSNCLWLVLVQIQDVTHLQDKASASVSPRACPCVSVRGFRRSYSSIQMLLIHLNRRIPRRAGRWARGEANVCNTFEQLRIIYSISCILCMYLLYVFV